MTGRPHRTAKVDENQAEIVADLRSLGAYIWITASLGGEVLDLIVFWHGRAVPVEVKRPGKGEDLTDGEREGIRRLREVGIEVLVATCTEDILQAFEEQNDFYFISGRLEDEAPEM